MARDGKVLDLFSCVGCHALGLFSAGGFETVAFCESNAWRRQKLARNFPGVPIFEDVRTIDPPAADICFGGPPCQRTSVAAAIHGYRDGESLWPFMLKAGLAAGVNFFVVEQPPGNAAWEAEVSNDLSNAGFHVGRLSFCAADVGAPYIRRRDYILACTSLPRLEVA
jgi:DNA (cytosine-5)-methyltransferase 1